ncbi:hypothetical protein T11_2557 [Trichinella zimbabwensis]|uniref:Uncharacterized protein n=1 Tax=Trichinella zimbabwensis TaxID=268475 RepID=A0A0V1E5K4_9BILA|nr:hypothetical protein T11_2557 [Trichinella zimbabwensis]
MDYSLGCFGVFESSKKFYRELTRTHGINGH